MADLEKKKKSYINERIVPRKQYKKLLSFGLASVILGILFGAMAGITFYASQGILNKNSTAESLGETIVIARDQDPQSSTESESTEETSDPEDQLQTSTEWSGFISFSEADIEPLDKDELLIAEEGESAQADGASESGEATGMDPAGSGEDSLEEDAEESAEDGEPEGDAAGADASDDGSEGAMFPKDENEPEDEAAMQEFPEEGEYDPDASEDADGPKDEENTDSTQPEDVVTALSLREMYNSISNGFVTVTIRDSAGTDLFDQPVTSRRDQFGVIIFESEEYLYILTDGTGIQVTSEVTMSHANRQVPVTIQEQDTLTNMMVLRARRQDFRYAYTVLELGNSFMVSPAEYVWMAGSPDGKPGAVDYGVVTYVNRMDEVTDGYRQLFTTNMQRSLGGSAVLFNKDCKIVGWVSDYSCGESERVYAAGISPLKYVIEDLCSAVNTAYLGVRCLTVNSEKSAETGLPTGLYVTEVEQNSPSYMMGIQAGDRIISINDYSVNDSRTLQDILDRLQSGKETVLLIERQGSASEEPLKVVLFVGKR